MEWCHEDLPASKDNYISESDRVKAIKDYRNWIENYAESQTLYLACVYGKK